MLNQNEIISLLKPHLKRPFVFLETANFDKNNTGSFLFKDFSEILTFNYKDDVDAFFKKAEKFSEQGQWLCGFFSYEFAYCLEPALLHLKEKNNFPLAWLACCKKSVKIINREHLLSRANRQSRGQFRVNNIKPSVSYRRYAKAIETIQKYLGNGTNYQTNFTFKIKFSFHGDILSFYLALRKAQPTSYMALINTGEYFIVSLSPELFFKRDGNKITTKPMKGTLGRGNTLSEDKINESKLTADKKIMAENLMIVDLLRNDLGRVSKKVWVPELFSAEKYRTLYQMTSTVSAKLKNSAGIREIFSSLFPSGSVTGAPKIKTMEIIKELEKEPRNIYTGAIGYISPDKSSCFNVAIRTITLSANKGEMGIGGGIVYDSSAKKEYEEALLKAKFLTQGFNSFSIIETMLWTAKKGYFLVDLHLSRLKKSCEYFSINLEAGLLEKKLNILAKQLKTKGDKFKIKILADFGGGFTLEYLPFDEPELPVKIRVSSQGVNPRDIFLYHKTTKRELYERERKKAQSLGFFEAIFLNKRGELTEGSISNIFVLKNGILYTPPVKCGLLPGILREHLLRNGRAKEKVLREKDIKKAQKLYIGNSVRGLLEAKLA
ncbi:MAG: aminodeoxychorismate synthase component I [Candidatus Omnitrophica bacterium]|jgi:para-aminobenzoate synthetase/4-amino-4-deoxychorismate lyase|nr:aminodeoxychorismate synthase component I [Candidatus Omnitrophota bacterium]